MSARALVTRGQAYAIYLHTTSKDEVQFEAGQLKIKLNLPAGQYQADWVDTRTGQAAASDIFRHETGACTLTAPAFTDDIGLAIQGLPKVLAYLKGISGKKIVAGQHNREPNADPDKWTQEIFATTHKSPGLWSGDFLFQADNIAHRQTMIDEAIRQWKSGAMINIMLHTCPPTQEEPCQWDPGVINQLLSDAQWKELVTDGTELNKNWKVRLDTIAPYLQQLKDAGAEVMFRPLHEMNQKVFWWGGRPGPNGTARLFRITHDYLTHIKGLDNLIWVWDMQDIDRTWAQYNPGEAYWDILAFDVYGNGYSQSWYEYAVSMAGDKPLAIGECSKLPTPAQLESQPRYVFFMPWAELVYRDNTPAQIIELYNSSRVMTLEELPLKPTE
ncbi:MAG: glycoside hydrolase family 26 protein [Phycisphaerae bacterium]|nr:glycoside hydrolase family 26 protein [Phycisphaerae bacterium]